MKTSFLPFLDQRNYFKDFCPVIVRAEIIKTITLLFGRNDVFMKPFRFLLTFFSQVITNAFQVSYHVF